MKPLLTHSVPILPETLPRCCLRLADWLTTADQREAALSGYSGVFHEHDQDGNGDSGNHLDSNTTLNIGNVKVSVFVLVLNIFSTAVVTQFVLRRFSLE